jgi:hypothetical protein
MNYNLLKVATDKVAAEAITKRGFVRKGYAHVHIPSPKSGGDEHHYFDLRGLGRHQQKFRNWCKKEFEGRDYNIHFGGGSE